MRVLILHNKYQQPGGEDVVAEQEACMLRRSGLDVKTYYESNDSIHGIASKIAAFAKTPYSRSREYWAADLVRQWKPDIVHIHNFFPVLTPAVHVGAAKAGSAVVQTLHNYRLLCANGMFLRHGKVCEDCLTSGRHNAVLSRCYRGSIAGSAAVTRMQARARNNRWEEFVHRFIALTEFSKNKYIEGGFSPDKIAVKPNFMPISVARDYGHGERYGGLFVGRISNEKGLRELLLVWPPSAGPLTVVGDGPDLAELRAAFGDRATFLGRQSRSFVDTLMAKAAFMIVPSTWYEGFPMTIVEAFASGLPVIASDIGSLSCIIDHNHNGLKFPVSEPLQLRDHIMALTEDAGLRRRLGMGALQSYRELYSEEVNSRQLLSIYADAIDTSRFSRSMMNGAE